MRRRGFGLALAASAALPGVLLAAGCGFHLRGAVEMPFERLALAGFDERSPLATALRRALSGRVELRTVPAEAQVVLTALDESRDRSVAATTAAGQVREIQLRLSVTVRADTPQGRTLIPPVTLRLTRDLSYTETAALAKGQEEAAIFRDLQADVVDQLLRRLAAVRV